MRAGLDSRAALVTTLITLMACNPIAPPVGTPPAILVGAGDIAVCGNPSAEATAKLVESVLQSPDATAFTLGDNVYNDGTTAEFANCYDPTWGRFKARTRPAPGNHDYHTPKASGYYTYFGPSAGDPSKGYYSYNLGAWHVIVLNSNCSEVGGCDAGSAQEQWLRADLAANPKTCTLAYWHHPRFSSGRHGSNQTYQPFWQALFDAGVDVVLTGHDHTYERFARQDPTGKADAAKGIRAFVVGTGGAGFYDRVTNEANSEVWSNAAWGVLKLTLSETRYTWEFLPVAGKTFTDSGSEDCH